MVINECKIKKLYFIKDISKPMKRFLNSIILILQMASDLKHEEKLK